MKGPVKQGAEEPPHDRAERQQESQGGVLPDRDDEAFLHSVHVHAAHAWITAPPAGTNWGVRLFRAGGMRRKRGKLLAQVGLPARWALYAAAIRRVPDQLLKLRSAIVALIFVDRHSVFDLILANLQIREFAVG